MKVHDWIDRDIKRNNVQSLKNIYVKLNIITSLLLHMTHILKLIYCMDYVVLYPFSIQIYNFIQLVTKLWVCVRLIWKTLLNTHIKRAINILCMQIFLSVCACVCLVVIQNKKEEKYIWKKNVLIWEHIIVYDVINNIRSRLSF